MEIDINTHVDDVREIIGEERYKNISDLFDRLKECELHPIFVEDYLQPDKVDKWFMRELILNEPQLDFSEPISDDELDELVNNINDGYSNGDLITAMVDGITDKYIGDCSWE